MILKYERGVYLSWICRYTNGMWCEKMSHRAVLIHRFISMTKFSGKREEHESTHLMRRWSPRSVISCVRCRIESPSGTIAQRVPCQGMLQPIKGIHRPTKLERIDPIFGRSNSRTCVEGKLIFDCFKLEISGHARLFASVVFCYFESFMSCTICHPSRRPPCFSPVAYCLALWLWDTGMSRLSACPGT